MSFAVDSRDTVRIDTDVVIVGGGAAGVAAAVTAARAGHRVVLVERHGFCGGGAVAGLSGTVCGLFEASDNPVRPPEQVVFGFAEEFVSALETRDGLGPPIKYGKTFTRVHDPLVWREAADGLLCEAGVEIIFHAVATKVLTDGSERIEGVGLWTKQGPVEVRAKVTIDASGDADLVAMAGLPNTIGDDGRVQNPTMIFRMLGVDTERLRRAYGDDSIMPAAVSDKIIAARESGTFDLPRAKIWIFETTRPGEVLCNATRIVGSDKRELNTLYFADFTEAEIEGRRQARQYGRFFQQTLEGFETAHINDTGVQVGVRQTRQLDGVQTLRNTDVVDGTKFSDGIARSPWPIELHSGEKPRVEWLLEDVYEIPFDCFVPQRAKGLLAAGRCLSAQHEAVASARVTAQCFSYGHAIGHAASMAINERIEPGEVDPAAIRAALNRDGARLD